MKNISLSIILLDCRFQSATNDLSEAKEASHRAKGDCEYKYKIGSKLLYASCILRLPYQVYLASWKRYLEWHLKKVMFSIVYT